MDIELSKRQLIERINESQSLWLLDFLERMRQNLNKETTNSQFTAITSDTRNFKFDREEANER